MTRQEHLLTVLIEEAAEVQQAASKALRFGFRDGYPDSKTTNAEDIATEFSQAIAAMEMLEAEGHVPRGGGRFMREIELKKNRIKRFMEYAESTGALEI